MSKSPLKPVFLVAVTGFWLVMTSLLIQREFFQAAPIRTLSEVMTLEGLDLREEYRAIYIGNERIGFSHTVLGAGQPGNDDPFELRFQTYLSFLFLGQEREMLIKGTAFLDDQLYVNQFNARISSGNLWTDLSGQIAKNNLNLVIESQTGEPSRTIIPMQGRIFFSETLNFLWTPANLKPGRKGRLMTWNPLASALQPIDFQVMEKTSIDYLGNPAEVFPVLMNYSGLETRSWVSPEGVVLREESPSGLILQKEEAWKIFDAMREERSTPPDLPNFYSVPSNRLLENQEALTDLKVRIKTPSEEKIIEIKKADLKGLEAIPLPVPLRDPALANYLESTAWITADDPAITAQAKEIAGGTTSALDAARALERWVHANISPVPTVSVPKATDVLQSRKGDCNEFTALFTAFARSLGIPTRMIAGLIYQHGRFFYHAWPEVHIGRWIAVDPTFGQFPADVTHIPLVEGGLEEQMALVNQIGRIKIFVMEEN